MQKRDLACIGIACGFAIILLGSTALPLQAQQLNAPILNRNGGIAGAGNGGSNSLPGTGRSPAVVSGFGHIGAGTGGTSLGVGNVTGGINGTALGVGSGGVGDNVSLGSSTGGIVGEGRGLNAGTGGVGDTFNSGTYTGGINGSSIGSGVGGIADLNGYASGTGGINEFNAVRYRVGQ
jgi:hypothetical protein